MTEAGVQCKTIPPPTFTLREDRFQANGFLRRYFQNIPNEGI